MGAQIFQRLLGLVVLLMGSAALVPAAAGSTTTPTDLVSGVESAKAALVRIEVSAVVEIVHINHSTGDVVLDRGRYVVPVREGTGVLTSADGVVATAQSNLVVEEADVVVEAANKLFANVIDTRLVGHGGDWARRAHAMDPAWDEHLNHCYIREEHCVLFIVPTYEVFLHTTRPTSASAQLISPEADIGGVGLLHVGSGGSMPTARLAASSADVEDAQVLGFTAKPAAKRLPSATAVTLDGSHVSPAADDGATLGATMVGAPVVDASAGEVVGLVAAAGHDGHTSLITAVEVRQAMDAAGFAPTSSQFDAVFQRAVDHLGNEGMGGSAQAALSESLTYFDSALAAYHLRQVEQVQGLGERDAGHTSGGGSSHDGAAASNDQPGGVIGWLTGTGWLVLAGLVALLAVGLAAVVYAGRQRSASTAGGAGGAVAVGIPPEPVTSGPRERQSRPEPAGGDPQPGVSASRSSSWRDSGSNAFCTTCGRRLTGQPRYCGGCGTRVG